MKQQFTIDNYQGYHNQNINQASDRIIRGNSYKDLSTICIIPTRGVIPAKVVQNWWSLLPAMNQKFIRIFAIGMEVGEAYSHAIENILNNDELNKWKYILTLEEDNMPPPDGLLKLYEAMNSNYDAISGIYWTKGEGGMPMIYGDPNIMPKNFIPCVPKPDTIQECNGLGMGFTLFKLDMFKDPKLPRPFFKTVSEWNPQKGSSCYTQDLYFYENAGKLGYRFACDTRIKVGHYDINSDIVW